MVTVTLWSCLPSDVRDVTDNATFKRRLKIVLFYRAYGWRLYGALNVGSSKKWKRKKRRENNQKGVGLG